jgi:hypothetical protein
MNVEVFVLCDAATDSGGKLNLLGAFDSIFARQVPVVHQHCSVAVRLRFSQVEVGDHRLRLSLIDADGRKVIPDMEGALQVRLGDRQVTAAVNLVINIQQLKLAAFGEYRVDLAVDGNALGALPFYVRPLPATPGEKAAS